ncbi:hypothetical protein CHS0354_012593 [Potamilus streckersoni]|uniref:Uncharacterized protein n=1 Tax=Potamilus streckersoni TaxID=2493646 RepID=A0AAE0SXE7_9BIVA|nr:hypothetical protein CHS0354_012593 [Potamilus streckersoni]
MAVMKRRNIFKRIMLVWCLVLIAYHGILLFATVLQQQVEKVFVYKSYTNNTTGAHFPREEIEKDIIKINMQVEPPPYEISAEAFPNNGSFRIERTIHQIWINKNIPEEFRNYVSSLKEHHRNYVYMFWTDKMALQFVEAMFPMILPFYVNYRHNLQRADAVRYMILYEYGGVYADLDIVSLRPLDPILRKYSCILSQEPHIHPIFYNNFYGLACNAFMACRCHHPFMKILVDNLPSFSVAAGILDSTGPRFVTIVYRNYIVDHPHVNKTDTDGVYLAPPEYFMPSLDPTLQNELEALCSKTKLIHLQKWLCEMFKRHGLGGPTNYTFTDHKWVHLAISLKPNKRQKTFSITKIIPDVKFYMQEEYEQTKIIAT